MGIFRQQKPAAATSALKLSRSSLASSARFTVTATLAPKSGKTEINLFQVEVSGNNARVDYSDAMIGEVRYIVNEKGTFFYIPANKAAQKQKASIEDGLKLVFAQAATEMQGAQKVGTASIAGIPTDVYRNPRTKTTIYVGTAPGFRLPVKVELKNEGGTRTLVASNIQLNIKIPAERFSLPAGTQFMESQGAPAGLSGTQ
jgi:membrane-bound lytic murein transglycosylase